MMSEFIILRCNCVNMKDEGACGSVQSGVGVFEMENTRAGLGT